MERILEVSDETCEVIESILNGTYRPLKGFMNRKEHISVIKKGKLVSGEFWSVPIVLAVETDKLERIKHEKSIILINKLNYRLARLFIKDVYNLSKVWYISGKLERINKPFNFNFKEYRRTIKDIRIEIDNPSGEHNIIGYSIDRILTKPDIDALYDYIKKYDSKLLIQQHNSGEHIDSFLTTVRCNIELLAELDNSDIIYNICSASLPIDDKNRLIMENVIHRNYACTHMITDIDVEKFDSDIRKNNNSNKHYWIEIIDYVKPIELRMDKVRKAFKCRNYDHPCIDNLYDNTIKILKKRIKPYDMSGICIHLIGLVNSGKSTMANGLKDVLAESTNRMVTILDSRSVAEHINHNLHIDNQSTKIKRIAYIVNNMVNNSGIVIYNSVNISDDNLKYFRESIEGTDALYLEVFIDTPLKVCEKRDNTGLYELARAGKIDYLAGVNIQHNRPKNSDIVFDNFIDINDINRCLNKIIDRLRELKRLR